MLTPRPYQEEMITCAVETLRRKPSCLIKAATGAGKTIVFAELIRRWLNDYPTMRILVLVHREVIVQQNADKLRRIWPSAPIGIACASASSRVDMSSPVVFGSIQTLASRISTMPMFHLVIIDEAHRLPEKKTEKKSQYQIVMERLQSYYPGLRIFGLTATPFRLNWGPIFGTAHKRQSDDGPMLNWFDTLDLEIGMKRLMDAQPDDENPDAPYLCGMRAFVEDKSITTELSSVATVAGEYNQGQLSDLMQKTIHLQTALDAYRKHHEGRSRCVVFGVDIDHAEKLRTVFSDAGIGCEVVHSEKAKDHNREVLARFDAGRIPVVVNVGVMTEGWDCRGVDLILLCRPTMSAALFVQIVGRGLRTFPGKKDVLVLDLAGNFNRHGAPWDPILPDYSKPGKPKQKEVQPDKKCPSCGHENPPRVWCCEVCGEILRVKQVIEAKAVKLRELNLSRMGETGIQEGLRGRVSIMAFSKHVTPQGNACLRVSVLVALEKKDPAGGNLSGSFGINACHFYRFDGPGAGFFYRFWRQVSNGLPLPGTIEDAIKARENILDLPASVSVRKDGKWWKVCGW